MDGQKKRISKSIRVFLILTALVIAMSLINWAVITQAGKTEITRLKLIGNDGMQYSALMYVPENAADDTPAPAVLCTHGASGSARNHESWAMEFARRGFVVISVDNYGAGNSQWEDGKDDNGYLAFLSVPELYLNYMLDCPIIDPENIILAGHSAGCKVSYSLARKYDLKAAMLCCAIEAEGTPENYYDGNILAIRGSADAAYSSFMAQVNQCFSTNYTQGFDLTQGDVQLDHLYGSFENGNARYATYIPGMIHEAAFVSTTCIQYLLNFAQDAVGQKNIPNYIEGSSQYWLVKDIIGQISLFVFLFWLMSFALMLIDQFAAFRKVKQPLPRNIGLRGKDMVISYSCTILFPIIVILTGGLGAGKLLGPTLNSYNNKVFTMGISNRAFSYVIGMAILGFLMLLLFRKITHPSLRDLGLTSEGSSGMDWGLAGRAFIVAMITIFVGWTYLSLQGTLLGTDFYCFFYGLKPLAPTKVLNYVPYILVYMAAFVVGSIGLNVEKRLPSTGNESRDLVRDILINMFFNIIVVIVFILIQNYLQTHIWTSGPKTWSSLGIDAVRIWGLPSGLALAAAGQTYCFRKTGNIWLGVFLIGTFAALSCVLYGATPFNAQALFVMNP